MRKIYLLFPILFVLGACGDFLEEHSTKLAYVESCTDLEELLIGGGYLPNVKRLENSPWSLSVVGDDAVYFPWIHVMDDDVTEFIVRSLGEYGGQDVGIQFSGFYCWQKNPFTNVNGTYKDDTWRRLYERIGVLNVILGQVDHAASETEELRKRVKGEALFLRANYYFLLVNFYAKSYNRETAATDPGVPVKTTDYIEDKYYSRDPVAKVYEQIVSDLEEACVNLIGIPRESVFQVSSAAAHALLGRVYLCMGEWEKAVVQCDSVQGYRLLSLVGRDVTKSFLYEDSPEMIFTQGSYCMSILMKKPNAILFCYQVSDSLVKLFDREDLRLSNFFEELKGDYSDYYGRLTAVRKVRDDKDKNISDNGVIRYAEVLLNKAEALAMSGRESEAIQLIGELRRNRFNQPEPLNKTGEKLIRFIREERRRELCFEGHRWFDLRRYAVSPKFPEEIEIKHISHNQDATESGTFVLKKYSEDKGWVLPIPDYVITFNNGLIEDNERDERAKL